MLRGADGRVAARKPDEPTITWYEPEQTVGFWIRRMAQESVIHRVDAELALGESLAAIPDDLARDGVDEVLVRFLSYGSRHSTDEFGDSLADCDGRSILMTTGGDRWLVRMTPEGVDAAGDGDPAGIGATVSGEPVDVLLWLWRRVDDEAVGLGGDRALVAKLRQVLGHATL